MINLKLKVKPTEVKEYGFIIRTGLDVLEANDYLHYYNLRSLLKRFIDRQFSMNPTAKQVTVRVNINEYESLKYISTAITGHPYYNALYISAVNQLDRQINTTRYLTF